MAAIQSKQMINVVYEMVETLIIRQQYQQTLHAMKKNHFHYEMKIRATGKNILNRDGEKWKKN